MDWRKKGGGDIGCKIDVKNKQANKQKQKRGLLPGGALNFFFGGCVPRGF